MGAHVDDNPPVLLDVFRLFLLAQEREQRNAGLVMHLLRDLLLNHLAVRPMINVEVVAEYAGKGGGRDEFLCRERRKVSVERTRWTFP